MTEENDWVESWLKGKSDIADLKELRRDHSQIISEAQEKIEHYNKKVFSFSAIITEKSDKIKINKGIIKAINERIKELKGAGKT